MSKMFFVFWIQIHLLSSWPRDVPVFDHARSAALYPCSAFLDVFELHVVHLTMYVCQYLMFILYQKSKKCIDRWMYSLLLRKCTLYRGFWEYMWERLLEKRRMWKDLRITKKSEEVLILRMLFWNIVDKETKGVGDCFEETFVNSLCRNCVGLTDCKQMDSQIPAEETTQQSVLQQRLGSRNPIRPLQQREWLGDLHKTTWPATNHYK